MKIDINTALQLLTVALAQANSLAASIRTARAEGREDLNEAEVDDYVGKDDAARDRLQDKIDAIR